MVYLDSSAFLKLYLEEDGSDAVREMVRAQTAPLPVAPLTELVFINVLKLKVNQGKLRPEQARHLEALYRQRKRDRVYFTPDYDRAAYHELCMQLTDRTFALGTHVLDVMQVAVARTCGATLFVTANTEQANMARAEGLEVKVI
jgi:predicted nucleic acid-binding protein